MLVDFSMGVDDEREGSRGRTRYQPVGFPVLPNLPWEVRMTRTLGAMITDRDVEIKVAD
jgi:hypothetical protein